MATDSPGTAPAPTRAQLFAGFFWIGVSGFGGVLPHARRMLVENRRWITDREFTELLSLGQTLPGPNIGNMAVVIGARFHGWRGSLLAFLGLLSAPLLIVLLLAQAYAHLAQAPVLTRALTGMAAAASGLILATGGRLALRLDREAWSLVILLGTFLAVFWLRLPLLAILLVLGPVGIGFGWRSVRAERQAGGREPRP